MTDQTTINDIDFAQLYRNHIQQATREPKTSQDWDKKALTMMNTCAELNSPYVKDFTSRMDMKGAQTLLDVGCGGGTIALSVANQFQKIYALDYSQGMLDVVQQRSEQLGLKHVECLLKSWDDNWNDVPECDIVVSSRSSMVNDIEDALAKLNAKAKKAVYMTMTVDKDFIDREILSYIGRDQVGFPSYIYAINLLHQQGYQATVDFTSTPQACNQAKPTDETGFIETVRWSLGELSQEEIDKLKHYYKKNQNGHLTGRPAQKKWAFVAWQKN